MSENWADLSEKLKRLGVSLGAYSTEKPAVTHKVPVDRVVEGRFLDTPFGAVFSSAHVYAADYIHGNACIRPSMQIDRLAKWAKLEKFDTKDFDDFVFLDTETTGLSGGTGTMAFMVGAARFVDGNLELEQFFLQNPAEELAMLQALLRFCGEMKAVVTYNGKAFDIPILNTRFILNGIESPFEGLPHFDLLPVSRRVWKARLAQCNLGNIERHILGLEREADEVPGYMVPEIYMDYLQSGDARPLKGIFTHNHDDVVSLAALFSTLNDLLEDPLGDFSTYASDTVSVGRLLGHLGEDDLAIQVYERGQSLGNDETAELAALLNLAGIYKRRFDYERALPIWAQAGERGSIAALIELAMLYEHRLKSIETALMHTEKAIELCMGVPADLRPKQLLYELQRRKARLTAKLQK